MITSSRRRWTKKADWIREPGPTSERTALSVASDLESLPGKVASSTALEDPMEELG
jgi:hypothetical protein